MIASRVANAMATLGVPAADVVVVERERCKGKCGDVARYMTDELGYLVVAPCDTCARLAGNRSQSLVRKAAPSPDSAAAIERELADVLLYFTTKWGPGTSRRQWVLLKARVTEIAARVKLPALLPPGWTEPKPLRTCAETSCRNTTVGRRVRCESCRLAQKKVWARMNPTPTPRPGYCTWYGCKDPSIARQPGKAGRPPKRCQKHVEMGRQARGRHLAKEQLA